MDEIIGVHMAILESQDIPSGCYSAEVSYMGSVVTLGHIKKNRPIQLGNLFLLTTAQRMTLSSQRMEILINRANHKHWKETPFAKLQISAESILTKKYKKPTFIPVTIVDPLYSTTTCGITLRIQFLYENSVFVQKSPDNPCHLDAMKIGVESGVMKEEDWDSKYYCILRVSNDKIFITPPAIGKKPSWNSYTYINDIYNYKRVKITCEVYKKTNSLDICLGSGSLTHDFRVVAHVRNMKIPLYIEDDTNNIYGIVNLSMSCLYSITEIYQLKAPISDSTSFVIDDITPETLKKEELTNLIILDDDDEGKDTLIQSNCNPILTTPSQSISNPIQSTQSISNPIQSTQSISNPILSTQSISNPILSTPSQSNPNPIQSTQSNPNPIQSTQSSSSPKQDRNENQQEYEPSTSDYFNYQPLLSQMMSRRVPTETTTTTTSFRFVKTQDEF